MCGVAHGDSIVVCHHIFTHCAKQRSGVALIAINTEVVGTGSFAHNQHIHFRNAVGVGASGIVCEIFHILVVVECLCGSVNRQCQVVASIHWKDVVFHRKFLIHSVGNADKHHAQCHHAIRNLALQFAECGLKYLLVQNRQHSHNHA